MEVSVKVRAVFPNEKYRAIVSVTIDNAIALHEIRLVVEEDSKHILFPLIEDKYGIKRNIYHPIDKETRELITDAVIAAVEQAENQ